jgi:hypothetical protein
MRVLRFALLVLALTCPALWAQGTVVAQAQARQARALVQKQLDAFAADDARKAFSFAAPGIQEMFKTPEQFLAMVRAQYPMVHRPASVIFFKPEAEGQDLVQRLQISDANGASWMVSYLLNRQKDGSWRIGAVVVLPAPKRLST